MSTKIMYDYIEGYCPILHYRCLMPIEYESQSDGEYHKIQCACDKWKLRESKLKST